MTHPFTTVINGGGLAGLSLGIALRKRQLPVVIHEAGRYPRHRVCGEFIAGADPSLFEELGIASAFRGALSLRSTVWHCGERRVLTQQLPTPVTGISRHTLDDRLYRLFLERGGILFEGSRARTHPSGNEGHVWATGRRPAKRDKSGGGWIGLKCHVYGLRLAGDLELHVGRRGYVGMSPVAQDCFNVCGLFRLNHRLQGDKRSLFFHYLKGSGLEHLIERLDTGELDDQSLCAVSALDYRDHKTTGNHLRLGDNFGLIAPMTGNGMSMAFESAALAAPFIENWARRKQTWEETVRRVYEKQRKTFAKRIQVARTLQPFLLNPCGQFILRILCATNTLPFQKLYTMTHHV